jgi:hypothetical protein
MCGGVFTAPPANLFSQQEGSGLWNLFIGFGHGDSRFGLQGTWMLVF